MQYSNTVYWTHACDNSSAYLPNGFAISPRCNTAHKITVYWTHACDNKEVHFGRMALSFA